MAYKLRIKTFKKKQMTFDFPTPKLRNKAYESIGHGSGWKSIEKVDK